MGGRAASCSSPRSSADIAALTRDGGKVKWVTPLTQYHDEARKRPVLWSGPVLAGDRLLVGGTLGELLAVSPYNRRDPGQDGSARPDPARAGDRQPHDLRLDRLQGGSLPSADNKAFHSLDGWPSSAGPVVGKSTLFNRLVGKRRAIVDDTPGVTRDVREAPAQLGDLAFTLLDTAGLGDDRRRGAEARMRRFTERGDRQRRRRAVS